MKRIMLKMSDELMDRLNQFVEEDRITDRSKVIREAIEQFLDREEVKK